MHDNRVTAGRAAIAFWLVLAATAASLVSIAAWQILLGAALVWILYSERRLEVPRSAWAAAAFLGWTLVSAAASAGPGAALPQIRKFYVWFTLPAVYTAVRGPQQAKRLLAALVAVGAASGAWSFVQLWLKFAEARRLGRPFYEHYIGARNMGFMSHWETFSGQMMMILAAALACAMFSQSRRYRLLLLGGAALVGVALVAGFTRSDWLGASVAALVLVALWRPKLLVLAPVALAAGWFIAPEAVRARIASAWRPGASDSNLHREALRATGWAMASAHPWVGFGPERVQANVPAYMPQRFQPIPPQWWYGHLHNVYLHYAAERGWPAVAALLAFALWALADFARAFRRSTEAQTILATAMAATVGVFTAAWFEVNLGDSEVLGLWLALLGAAYGSLRPDLNAELRPVDHI